MLLMVYLSSLVVVGRLRGHFQQGKVPDDAVRPVIVE